MDLGLLDKPAERPLHPAMLDEDELLKAVTMERGRTGGPGGQHRNKNETAVTLTHGPTGINAQAGERRHAEINRKVALRRLRLKLAVEHRVELPAGDVRSALWRERCKKRRIVCSEKHGDYPAMLAEALDVVAACGWDQKKAAVRLDVSATQLIRFVATHAPALVAWNEAREARGMGALRA
ncbi:MAG: peptide chain release factor-like protein [Phycisphaerales bacterium]